MGTSHVGPTRRCSEPQPVGSLGDKSSVNGAWPRWLTFTLPHYSSPPAQVVNRKSSLPALADTPSDAVLTAAKIFHVFRGFRGLTSPFPSLIILPSTRPAPAGHRPFSSGSARCALARELIIANLRKHVSPL